MYSNAYEMKMPTNYVDMNAFEIEYGAGASGNGEYRKKKAKVKYTKEASDKATQYTIAYLGIATGGLGLILGSTIWSAASIGLTILGMESIF